MDVCSVVWCSSQDLAQWPGSRPVSCPATPSSRHMNKVFVKRHQQGDTLHLGLSKLFSCFQQLALFLSGPFLLYFILSPGGITHFEKANISYRLALRQTFFPLSPPPVGRTLFNSPLIMFLFRSRVHDQFLEAADGRSLLIGHINHQVCYLSFQMFAIMDIYIYLDILWLTIRRERAEVRVFISLMIISHCTSRQWRTYAHNAQGHVD